MCGRWGIAEPHLPPCGNIVFFSNFALSNFRFFQQSSTICLLIPKNKAILLLISKNEAKIYHLNSLEPPQKSAIFLQNPALASLLAPDFVKKCAF